MVKTPFSSEAKLLPSSIVYVTPSVTLTPLAVVTRLTNSPTYAFPVYETSKGFESASTIETPEEAYANCAPLNQDKGAVILYFFPATKVSEGAAGSNLSVLKTMSVFPNLNFTSTPVPLEGFPLTYSASNV